tara:strand:+ start:4089 stop:4847 length:759 start_codon:yes stop_codon:yes gene_type:complete
MDYKKYDKDGNLLNLIPLANRAKQANYYQKLQDDPDWLEPTPEDIKCELQLQALNFWEPLAFKIDVSHFMKEVKALDGRWVPYLRREGLLNDREGISLMGLPNATMEEGLSMPEACKKAGRRLSETEFNTPTEAYDMLPSLHNLLDYFQPLGRTMLVKANAGGFFPPHKDHPHLTRDTFRVVAFPSWNVTKDEFDWEMENTKVPIKPGGVYYCDTRKTHRTACWVPDSIHLILNIPKTWENVIKLMSMTKAF